MKCRKFPGLCGVFLIWIAFSGCSSTLEKEYQSYVSKVNAMEDVYPYTESRWYDLRGRCRGYELVVAGKVEDVKRWEAHLWDKYYVKLTDITVLKGDWEGEFVYFVNSWNNDRPDCMPDFPLEKGMKIIAFLLIDDRRIHIAQETEVKKVGYTFGDSWIMDYRDQREMIRGLLSTIEQEQQD